MGSLNGFPEWEEHFDSGTRFDDEVRCLSAGVGRRVQWHPYKWSLVSCREVGSHQLPRADSCYVCSDGSLPEQGQRSHLPETRQPDYSIIHKPHEGLILLS